MPALAAEGGGEDRCKNRPAIYLAAVGRTLSDSMSKMLCSFSAFCPTHIRFEMYTVTPRLYPRSKRAWIANGDG